MEQLVVRVTQDDINNGVPGNPHLCPIARAVRRAGRERVSVDNDEIVTRSKTFDLPTEAVRFLCRFDASRPVKPFTFSAPRLTNLEE